MINRKEIKHGYLKIKMGWLVGDARGEPSKTPRP